MSKIKINQAIDLLRKGEIVIYPTEGVWGLGALASNLPASNKIYKLKKRPRTKPLLMIVANLQQIEKWVELNTSHEHKILTHLEPTTWVVTASKNAPKHLVHNQKIAFRVSSHPVCKQLSLGVGEPIISTSANIHGQPVDRASFESFFPNIPIVEGSLGSAKTASTILDIETMQQLR